LPAIKRKYSGVPVNKRAITSPVTRLNTKELSDSFAGIQIYAKFVSCKTVQYGTPH
jgi:hypothetical protein